MQIWINFFCVNTAPGSISPATTCPSGTLLISLLMRTDTRTRYVLHRRNIANNFSTAFARIKSFQVDGDPFRNESVLLSRVLQRCSDGRGEGSASAWEAFFASKSIYTRFPHYPDSITARTTRARSRSSLARADREWSPSSVWRVIRLVFSKNIYISTYIWSDCMGSVEGQTVEVPPGYQMFKTCPGGAGDKRGTSV